MARRRPASGDEPPREGLTHNPFASLRRPSGEPAAREPAPEPAPRVERAAVEGAPGRVVVRRERKGRGGKAVTLADGPGLAALDLPELARAAARALGVGARVEDGALVVQGEQTERLSAWLAARGLGPIVRGN
jgi:translation initiation factor 1